LYKSLTISLNNSLATLANSHQSSLDPKSQLESQTGLESSIQQIFLFSDEANHHSRINEFIQSKVFLSVNQVSVQIVFTNIEFFAMYFTGYTFSLTHCKLSTKLQ
jgi:hypothetical protein